MATALRSLRVFITKQNDHNRYVLSGRWCIENARAIENAIRQQDWPQQGAMELAGGSDFQLDLSGACLIRDLIARLRSADIEVHTTLDDHGLLEYLGHLPAGHAAAPASTRWNLHSRLAMLGRWTLERGHVLRDWLGFLGQLATIFLHGLIHPRHLRLKSVSHHIYTCGVQAIPIVALIAFLISVVLAYQGATQLTRFGADIYTIDLVTLSVLREMGVLLTAIMVAGRSGSAFAAELGVMKINQEVDALQVMGLEPMEVLVLPRVLGLMIALPMLTLIADLMGMAGAAVLSYTLLHIPLIQFGERVYSLVANDMWMFWVGIIKAPVFALLIAAVGTLRGMQVEKSAERVGSLTTQAVVESIFLVILADALFSILFSRLGL
jgi:phospholipid/cholesterol/gamma-HCH transport system permease protein